MTGGHDFQATDPYGLSYSCKACGYTSPAFSTATAPTCPYADENARKKDEEYMRTATDEWERCFYCRIELSETLDAYYGKDPIAKGSCSKCRTARSAA